MVKERRSLFMMIVPLMVLMWLTSALLIWGLIPNLDFVRIASRPHSAMNYFRGGIFYALLSPLLPLVLFRC